MDYIRLYQHQQYLQFRAEIEDYVKRGLASRALSILQEALRASSDHPGIYFLLGYVFYENKDFTKAVFYVKQALFYDSSNDEYLALLGAGYYETKDFESAHNYSEQAYQSNVKNTLALRTLGRLELERKNIEKALQYVEMAVDVNSEEYDSIRLLSKCCMAKGNDDSRTLELLGNAKKLGSDDELDSDIIKVLYRSGEYDICLKYCKKLLMKNPNSPAAQKAREISARIKSRETNEVNGTKALHQTGSGNPTRQTDSLEEALNQLNSLTGLQNIKDEVNRIVKLIQFESKRSQVLGISNKVKPNYHFVFLGNPGTGKTIVARLIGDILFHLGILEKGHLVETDRSSIVGQYIGQTAQLTKEAIKKAMGGVLFIDEAYALARGGINSNDFGPEAIDTLIKAMEDLRGSFTVILAGYTKEMRELMKLNPGLKSRINLEINFPNYRDDELLVIAKGIAAQNVYTFSADAEEAFLEKINREKVDDTFANARTVRNLVEAAIREKAYRIGDGPASKEEMSVLNSQDFGIESQIKPWEKVEVLLGELNRLTGLTNVKEMIHKVVRFVEFQYKKKEMGLHMDDLSLNMIFLGNPGTGKTTVARIVSRILNALGVLKKGHLVEVTREDLVGQYIGQTAPKTLDKIKQAYGGILFIDEAYSLNQGIQNDFGKEALSTLIKEMEDNRDKLAIIMAGYTDEMKGLLDINPGLKSRIGYTIDFPDYNPEEMLDIFQGLCTKEGYHLMPEATDKIANDFRRMYDQRDRNFGNGRLVRQCFENVKMLQALRVVQQNIERDQMLNIVEDDIILRDFL